MDDLQKLIDWAEENHYLKSTRERIDAASRQLTGIETELTTLRQRLAEAEILLEHIARGKCYCESPAYISCYPCKAKTFLAKVPKS
jgi:hypothetical protein